MSPADNAPERDPRDSNEGPEPGGDDPDDEPDGDPDDDGVPFGLEVPGAALDRQVSCPHGFDPRFCPFGCA